VFFSTQICFIGIRTTATTTTTNEKSHQQSVKLKNGLKYKWNFSAQMLTFSCRMSLFGRFVLHYFRQAV